MFVAYVDLIVCTSVVYLISGYLHTYISENNMLWFSKSASTLLDPIINVNKLRELLPLIEEIVSLLAILLYRFMYRGFKDNDSLYVYNYECTIDYNQRKSKY